MFIHFYVDCIFQNLMKLNTFARYQLENLIIVVVITAIPPKSSSLIP